MNLRRTEHAALQRVFVDEAARGFHWPPRGHGALYWRLQKRGLVTRRDFLNEKGGGIVGGVVLTDLGRAALREAKQIVSP